MYGQPLNEILLLQETRLVDISMQSADFILMADEGRQKGPCDDIKQDAFWLPVTKDKSYCSYLTYPQNKIYCKPNDPESVRCNLANLNVVSCL